MTMFEIFKRLLVLHAALRTHSTAEEAQEYDRKMELAAAYLRGRNSVTVTCGFAFWWDSAYSCVQFLPVNFLDEGVSAPN